ncbi:yeats family-domain-containing protein [Mucor lusitanicus]|nr:yeats family-domain-containing protein [Mucor lusitanicus]
MEKRIKINCSSNIIKGRFTNNGDQWRAWTVTLEVPNVDMSEHIDHVEYVLHASFGLPPIVCTDPPYQLQKEGWGEFDLVIHVYMKDPQVPSPQSYTFDLHFKKSRYAACRKIILGSDVEYKQQDFVIDLESEQDLQARARASPRRRRPTPKLQELQQASGSKKSKKAFQRQGTTSSSSSFSPASSPSTTSSPSSVTSLITPPADSNNKDLQQQQMPQHSNVVVQQDPSQDKQMRVCRSPHYILDPANDLSLVVDIETIDMQELKALLEALDDTHLRQAFQIMKKYDTSKMNIQTTDNGAYYLIDMDTACSDLINELWEFVIDVEIEKCKESSTLSEQQQHQH